tara:strand:+ start:1250 stop:1456 length:207 start_codon:yes stop_codon:yes gene_type:complete
MDFTRDELCDMSWLLKEAIKNKHEIHSEKEIEEYNIMLKKVAFNYKVKFLQDELLKKDPYDIQLSKLL